jgi:DeoR/GlpR family transcriptional regulator of sugar metabolism
MAISRSTTFIQRMADESRNRETSALADYIVNHLLDTGAILSVLSGTTAAAVAELALRTHKKIRVTTNCVPLASRFMELEEQGCCAQQTSVFLTAGRISSVTGATIVEYRPKETRRQSPSDPDATLICSPHGFNRMALFGDNDVDEFKFWLNQYRRIILPVQWEKFGKEGRHKFKNFKQWKNVKCDMVVLDHPLDDPAFTMERIAEGNALLNEVQQVMGQDFKIHRVKLQ